MARSSPAPTTTLRIDELRQLLEGIAGQQGTLPYAGLIKAFNPGAPALQRLVPALEVLQWQDAALGRPQLVAVVVQKRAPYPRAGFFRQARLLGIYDGPDDGPQAEMWHQDQLEQVWMRWGQSRPGRETRP